MSTAYHIQITPDNTGLAKIQQSESSAKKVTDLLNEDVKRHHVYFKHGGFHNHISHQLLSLYGAGASPEDLQKAYDDNASYQRPVFETHEEVSQKLGDWETAKKHLGKEQYYPDFLAFFQGEIERLGWEEVLKEYLFKGDERSDDMFIRMFAGYHHSLIQLMYGLEWKQPLIVAMGLAQGASHRDNMRKFLLTAEEAAEPSPTPMPSIASLIEEVGSNEKLRTAGKGQENGLKIDKGILPKAWDEILEIAKKVKVKPEELEEKTAELYHMAICACVATAFHPTKEPRMDFFLMHGVTVAPVFLTINSLDWIPIESKVRLLEWMIRMELVQYAARACPPLQFDKLASYVPKDKNVGPAKDQLPRIFALDDDGHAIKLVRALVVGQEVSEKFQDKDWIKIRGNDLWTRIHHLAVDCVESGKPQWVYSAGEPEAWEQVPDRKDAVDGVSEQLEQAHL
ncbi:hypothetical protein M426DRAFT_320037 [Hypoxylon sp. CI-4A]|nr:hypothetical protein M426DRAFT_320037 [Hypoxylon sp. CI-4A]